MLVLLLKMSQSGIPNFLRTITYVLSRLRSCTLWSSSALRTWAFLLTHWFESFLCLTHCKFRLQTLSPLCFCWVDLRWTLSSSFSLNFLELPLFVSVNWLDLLLLNLASTSLFENSSTFILDLLGHLRVGIRFTTLCLSLLIRSLFSEELFIFLDQIVKRLFHFYVHICKFAPFLLV